MTGFPHYNIVVIGGGIHGLGIASQAAMMGYSVALFEQDDLGASGSSAFASVVGSNLRKLEKFNVAEVISTLSEQKQLSELAPHLFDKIQFQLAHDETVRSEQRIRVGLKIYNKLFDGQKNAVPTDESIKELLKVDSSAFVDFRVRDYRLTLAMAIQASTYGAMLHPRCAVVDAKRLEGQWEIGTQCSISGVHSEVSADVLINCTGHASPNVLKNIVGSTASCPVHSKLAHYLALNLTLPKNQGVALQAPDKQLVYLSPATEQVAVFGPYSTSMGVSLEQAKADMMALYSRSFTHPLSENDILYKQSFVRAECEDPCANDVNQRVDVTLDLDNPSQSAPLINVLGLSFLRHRKIAEQTLSLLAPYTSPRGETKPHLDWIHGGEFGEKTLAEFKQDLSNTYPFLPMPLVDRYAEHYGSLSHQILSGIYNLTDMGKHFGHGLYEVEVTHLVEEEWALTAEDILWRRTPLGLHFKPGEVDILNNWLRARNTV